MSSATSPSYTARSTSRGPGATAVRPPTRWGTRVAVPVLSAGLGLAAIILLPHLLGTTWSQVGLLLRSVSPTVLLGLLGLWIAGLLVHLPVLRAALPGLTARQALGLNLAGSAVANVMPAGGAAGVGMGYAMARRWGFSAEEFASFALVSNLWNAAARFVVGSGLLLAAVAVGVAVPAGARTVVVSATTTLAVLTLAALAALHSEAGTRAVARRCARLWRWAPRRLGGRVDHHEALTARMLGSRRAVGVALSCGWRRMTVFVLAYLVLQGLLLLGCLDAVHAGASLGAVAVAFGLERLITLAPVTPGAAGVAELGAVAALHALGVDPVAAAGGVLLYRSLIYALEIPLGAAVAFGWWVRR